MKEVLTQQTVSDGTKTHGVRDGRTGRRGTQDDRQRKVRTVTGKPGSDDHGVVKPSVKTSQRTVKVGSSIHTRSSFKR